MDVPVGPVLLDPLPFIRRPGQHVEPALPDRDVLPALVLRPGGLGRLRHVRHKRSKWWENGQALERRVLQHRLQRAVERRPGDCSEHRVGGVGSYCRAWKHGRGFGHQSLHVLGRVGNPERVVDLRGRHAGVGGDVRELLGDAFPAGRLVGQGHVEPCVRASVREGSADRRPGPLPRTSRAPAAPPS